MVIEVKGINDTLVMKVSEDCQFDTIVYDLESLLDQPIFQQDGYYPKAFFDFGCRVLEENDIEKLFQVILTKKKIIFDGISLPHVPQQLDIERCQLHNGEESYIYNETLFLEALNPGSFVYCYDNAYFLNVVRGTIVLMNENIRIHGHDFQNATIRINQETLHDLTTSALTTIYYEKGRIIVDKEVRYDKNYSCYIG